MRFVESCKIALDQGRYANALLVDLSKAHELLIENYIPIDSDALLQIYSYLAHQRQTVKVNWDLRHMEGNRNRSVTRIGL